MITLDNYRSVESLNDEFASRRRFYSLGRFTLAANERLHKNKPEPVRVSVSVQEDRAKIGVKV